jgi:hypothetical protein
MPVQHRRYSQTVLKHQFKLIAFPEPQDRVWRRAL